MKYVIIQPWFPEPGHPAQSLINTYRAIKSSLKPSVLVYIPERICLAEHLQKYILECEADITSCPSILNHLIGTLAAGTVSTVYTISKNFKQQDSLHVFFLDVNLYLLSITLKLFKVHVIRFNVLCMVGPEFFQRNKLGKSLKWPLVRTLFNAPYFHLFLRTPELAEAWKAELPEFADRIDYLPSLELPERQQTLNCTSNSKSIGKTFLVLGQIRREKTIALLVEIFSAQKAPGKLRIAGKIVDPLLKPFLQMDFENILIYEQFLNEHQFAEEFNQAHYSLLLYDPWDERMESAMLFTSLKYCCPVVAFEGGWLGRLVKEERIGWTLAKSEKASLGKFLNLLPSPETFEYQKVLVNMQNCYERWSSPKWVESFLNKLGWSKL